MAKITNKENLISQLAVVHHLLSDEENSEQKMIIESMFALQQMIGAELINRLCRENIYKVLSN